MYHWVPSEIQYMGYFYDPTFYLKLFIVDKVTFGQSNSFLMAQGRGNPTAEQAAFSSGARYHD